MAFWPQIAPPERSVVLRTTGCEVPPLKGEGDDGAANAMQEMDFRGFAASPPP